MQLRKLWFIHQAILTKYSSACVSQTLYISGFKLNKMEHAKTILKSEYILRYKTMLLKFCQNHTVVIKVMKKMK